MPEWRKPSEHENTKNRFPEKTEQHKERNRLKITGEIPGHSGQNKILCHNITLSFIPAFVHQHRQNIERVYDLSLHHQGVEYIVTKDGEYDGFSLSDLSDDFPDDGPRKKGRRPLPPVAALRQESGRTDRPAGNVTTV
ncbi:hypothetical protein H1164_09455 [Thermoactinomyces daqus]|uniref:Uncharacterized protein n=1 Tax=Thermoactinomyces daqus TaxID=1329516 RepID=A0A7W1XAP5_9BACL|nr:hypothetical protein [Thermoactinomyces daqus]MBA4543127.1 hypothetical protein [Thermoactinomyces daqus]